ncbi:unnamed protein product (macronuclear) [Paramecium tetraurelia]|uniref:Uncharacterized protein n=1 Tax=Paramecium tetraurelia TaxID=5888 RepID=A0DZJ6_PARTE|nr:uncharacterized protein GSPATT00021630001 [Paramecium tetraurelia]CAK88463.1 unnamed protein product [Paramecium tetraurelia]|eukprot:XP_001455860.1 hypothetical protein (macronuclear) [Paramecium tetraurelia strain d4-2]
MPMKLSDSSAIYNRLRLEIESIQNTDDQLFENMIKFLETQFQKPNFNQYIEWLITQPINNEYQFILMLQFYSGMIVNNKEIYDEFKKQKHQFNTILIQVMEYCINKKKLPQLKSDKIDQLREYLNSDNHSLKPYALLFLSQYDTSITNFPDATCHPEILLQVLQYSELNDHQLQFVISQIYQGINQWHLYYLAQLFVQLNKFKPSPLFLDLIQKVYVERVLDQEGNYQFDFRILKNFIQVAQKNQAFKDYKIYMQLLKRVVEMSKETNFNEKTLENIIRTVYFSLRELCIENEIIFDEISQYIISEELIELKKFLEEWLSNSIILESLSIVNLFKLNIPEGFCEKYMTTMHIQEKHLRAIIRLVNQSNQFQLNERTCDILVSLINKFKVDYLKYLQPNNLQIYPRNLIRQVVKAVISNSNDESIIEFIHKNVQHLQNNKSTCEEIGLDFQFIGPYIKFQIEAEFTAKVDFDQLSKWLQIYNYLATIDDEIITKVKQSLPKFTPSQISSLLSQCDQLRDKLKDFDKIHELKGQNNFIDVYLNHKGNLPKSIQTIDDILLANSKCLDMNYFKSKKIKSELLRKLQETNEIPNGRQAYELLLGWRASDFSIDTFESLIKIVKDQIMDYDFHHTHKLISKLVQQYHLHPAVLFNAYKKLQNVLSSNLKDAKDKVSIIKLAIILKRIYPTLTIQLTTQEDEECQFVNQIIENIYFNKGNVITEIKPFMQPYNQFYPYVCQNLKDFTKGFATFQDKLNVAIPAYVQGVNLKVNTQELVKELEKPSISALQQLKLACLTAGVEKNEFLKRQLRWNFSHIDPSTNYLFQDDLVICFDVMNKLFPNEEIGKKLELLVINAHESFYEPTLIYLFTEHLLTRRSISIMEDWIIKWKT